MINIPEIEKTARAATPGPWKHYNKPLRAGFSSCRIIEVQPSAGGRPIVSWNGFDDCAVTKKQHNFNARHMASVNPAAVLEMAQLIRGLAVQLDYIVEALLLPGGRHDLDLTSAIEALEKARLAGVEVDQ